MATSNLIFDAKTETTERDEVWVPTDLSNRKSLLQQGGEFLSLDFSLPVLSCWSGRVSVAEQLILSDDENRARATCLAVSATCVHHFAARLQTVFRAVICR